MKKTNNYTYTYIPQLYLAIILISLLGACQNPTAKAKAQVPKAAPQANYQIDTTYKTIHVFVALCDNKYQGIVPVPASIGNGQNPNTNLYWGCKYGIKSFFKNSKNWTLISETKLDTIILERLVFKHKTQKYYLVADAYNGQYIQPCLQQYLRSSAGLSKGVIPLPKGHLGILGNAQMLAYIGHNGFMDFSEKNTFANTDGRQRDVIILACYSQRYFAPLLHQAKVNPMLWSTHFMSPEAYTLHDALEAYMAKQSVQNIRGQGAQAYSKYQKCSLKAAMGLLVNGW